MSHVLNILCHSIQYHSFPLFLTWPQRWGNYLICLPTHREFLGKLEKPQAHNSRFSCNKGRRARCSTCSFQNILHTARKPCVVNPEKQVWKPEEVYTSQRGPCIPAPYADSAHLSLNGLRGTNHPFPTSSTQQSSRTQ